MLSAPIDLDAEAASMLIGGAFNQQSGTIERNGKPYDIEDRKRDSWLVRRSEIKRFGFITQSLKAQIRYGFRTVQNQYLRSEDEIIRHFKLTPERYTRLMRQFSNEGWRASCAVGLANGRRVFCFPYIESGFIFDAHAYLFDETINLLKSSGALVLLPIDLTNKLKDLCDEVVNINQQSKGL